jgi:hypothetical protein
MNQPQNPSDNTGPSGAGNTISYPSPGANPTPVPPRAWPAVLLIAILWLFRFITGRMELTTFERFGSLMLVQGLVLILFIVWWLVGLSFHARLRGRLIHVGNPPRLADRCVLARM